MLVTDAVVESLLFSDVCPLIPTSRPRFGVPVFPILSIAPPMSPFPTLLMAFSAGRVTPL